MLCLFDLDGTLVDSEPGITACIRHAFARLGVAVPANLKPWIGPPLRHSFAPYLDGDHARIEAAVAAYNERFATEGWHEYAIYPGIGEVVEHLRAAGHQLAIVTGKPIVHATPIVHSLPFGAAFERIYGPPPTTAHSEKATLIAQALEDFAAGARDTVMIGDRHFDIDGAVANRVRGIGVLWGFGSRDELAHAGANALVATPAGLAATLDA
jgi:phosphoglycolate phosphatase